MAEILLRDYHAEARQPIHGPGIVVEIDETLFGMQKYKKRRLLSQTWVLGRSEHVSMKLFLVPFVKPLSRNHDAQTLVPLLKKYVLPVNDGWTANWTISHKPHRILCVS